MAKIAFQKSDVNTLTCIFCHCTAENKDIALKFCMRTVCMHLDNIYCGFFGYFENFEFMGKYLQKIEILSFGVKIEEYKKPR